MLVQIEQNNNSWLVSSLHRRCQPGRLCSSQVLQIHGIRRVHVNPEDGQIEPALLRFPSWINHPDSWSARLHTFGLDAAINWASFQGSDHCIAQNLFLIMSLRLYLPCRALGYLVDEPLLVERYPNPTGLILRQAFELLEEQTVEPWAPPEVEDAATSVQQLLKIASLGWLQVCIHCWNLTHIPACKGVENT